ncbi:MAG: AEC family transporter, partial [Desulfosudaceae bacterium]
MALFISTFESVAALLGIGFLGFFVISRKILPDKALGFLSPLALDIALPSLVFVNILVHFQPAESTGWWTLPLWWLGFTLFLAVLTGVF